MHEALSAALALFLDPSRLSMMLLGVGVGLVVGVLPGMGGIVSVAILLPFITRLDPVSSLAMITGSLAVVHTSDTITSVLIGAPGSAAAVPTMIEGHPMARQGQAARALSAAYAASLIGGLIGALGLTLSIPIARPLVLSFGSPELFMLTALGVSFAGSLLGKEARRGILAGLLGLLLGAVGPSPAAAEVRFAFDQVYLSDGLDLAIVALGLFGVAEVIGLLARGGAVAEKTDLGSGWLQGLRDVVQHRWLVLRGSLIGVWAGVLPALGATAGTLMAYGHVVSSSRDRSRFGKGDIRGIIAPEAANNAVEAGDLIPTLLFSVPGSAPTAIILGALLAYGIVPGPRIVTDHLDLVYTIVWSFAAANFIGAGIMFAASPLLARTTYVPFNRIAPAVILIMVLAAYQETRHFGDILTLLVLGLLGYAMKITGWPRAPMLIGFVLSGPLERYYFLTINLYQQPADWLLRPGVIVLGLLLVAPFAWGARQALRQRATTGVAPPAAPPGFRPVTLFSAAALAVFAAAAMSAREFLPGAALMPLSVAVLGTALAAVQLVQELRGRSGLSGGDEEGEGGGALGGGQALRRAAWYLAGLCGYSASIWLVGMRAASVLWLLGFLVSVARMRPLAALLYAAAAMAGIEVLSQVLGVRLPQGVLIP
jgi:putative tricarboxylic transport membrane protein